MLAAVAALAILQQLLDWSSIVHVVTPKPRPINCLLSQPIYKFKRLSLFDMSSGSDNKGDFSNAMYLHLF